MAVMESIGATPLMTGNKVTLLVNGDPTFSAMLKAISEAKDHINFETYIIDDDETGNLFADLLIKKQAEGVQVNVIYDSFGCRSVPTAFFQRLRNGGIRTVEFNPINPFKVRNGDIHHRTHRKILIVDGAIAFTGGINIGSAYHGRETRPNAINRAYWRDTHVMIEGPAVREFQKLFLTTWVSQNGPELFKGAYFPAVPDKGNHLVQVVGSSPGYTKRITYIMYISAITHARTYIHMTHSYFVPDRQMIQVLTDAAKRGVDVKLVLPENTDHASVRHAGRSYYSQLMKAGVKIYERSDVILHAKTAVVDGVWSTIGSTNLELWSFVSNDEVNAVVLGREFAEEMEEIFERDLKQSVPILPEDWNKRPLFDRTKELLARIIEYWL